MHTAPPVEKGEQAVARPPKKIQVYKVMGFRLRLAASAGTIGYIRGMTVEVELEKKLRNAANRTMAAGTRRRGMLLLRTPEIKSTRPASAATLIRD